MLEGVLGLVGPVAERAKVVLGAVVEVDVSDVLPEPSLYDFGAELAEAADPVGRRDHVFSHQLFNI